MKNNELIWTAFSQEEIDKIVQLKRIFECMEGDKSFHAAIKKSENVPEVMKRLRKVGVSLEKR